MPSDEGCAAAMAGLPGMTPVRLAKLLEGLGAGVAWDAIVAGTHPADPDRRFMAPARTTEVQEVADRYDRAGVAVLSQSDPSYPRALLGDPGAPSVIFAVGDPGAADGTPSVAIVGTRSATPYGRRVASEMGAALAAQGIVVVSGLARGIDAAAHAGVLRGPAGGSPPVAVVGTGLDVVYPPSNAALWEQVSERGAIFSESPLGTVAHPRVFPARNRIIAALADVVVVVECHHTGGSFFTVDAAARRGIPVCAVPGSIHSRASAGTNSLLVDGCIPVRDAADVVVAVSLARKEAFEERQEAGGTEEPGGSGPRPTRCASEEQQLVLAAVDETPTLFETILLRTNLSISATAKACEELVGAGHLSAGAGWWCREAF